MRKFSSKLSLPLGDYVFILNVEIEGVDDCRLNSLIDGRVFLT